MEFLVAGLASIPALALLLLFILTGVVARYIQRRQPSQATQVANRQTQSSSAAQQIVIDREAVDPNTKPGAIASQKDSVDKQSAAKVWRPRAKKTVETVTQLEYGVDTGLKPRCMRGNNLPAPKKTRTEEYERRSWI